MKRVALALVFILLVVLIWSLRKEKYVQSDVQKIDSFFNQFNDIQDFNVRYLIIKSILNELDDNKELELSNVNLLIDTFNSSNVISTKLVHYPNVWSLDNMFDLAYTRGESVLFDRGRIILRAFAWPGIDLTTGDELRRSNAYTPFTYTSEGIPDYTSTVIAESGKTAKDMLRYCFMILDKLFSARNGVAGNPWTPEMIDYVNSTIPDKYAPKFDRTNNMSIQNALLGSDATPAAVWFMKALAIGPAYISWLAENKWHLDLNWTP